MINSSSDAEAAARIYDALRAASIEVWFDKSELRGGDAWDSQIKKQIHDCALFVAVISGHTNARSEGYCCRARKQATRRLQDMTDARFRDTRTVRATARRETVRVPSAHPDSFASGPTSWVA
jgi:hypothetical protein